jgi:hypothetical protein
LDFRNGKSQKSKLPQVIAKTQKERKTTKINLQLSWKFLQKKERILRKTTQMFLFLELIFINFQLISISKRNHKFIKIKEEVAFGG